MSSTGASEEAMKAVADFFAQKKRKKPFMFNANLVDANSVVASTHVDAPALSTEEPKSAAGGAVARPVTPEPTAKTEANSNKTEQQPVMDMKALQGSSTGGLSQSDNIAEKLRIEETKKQLAAAREGMERQAQRLAEEKAAKEAAAAEKAQQRASSIGGAGAAGGGMGGRWVAPHMRSMQMAASRLPGATLKLDTASEELFPDLQAAEKKIQEKQQQQTQSVTRIPKKTPVGGGASWASKAPKLKLTSTPKLPKSSKSASAKKTEPAVAATPTPTEGSAGATAAAATTPEPAPPAAASPAPALTIQPKITRKTGTKKKKKDLSTFKPGGAS